MPVDISSRDFRKAHDRDHSKRRDRSLQGIKVPNDFRRGRKHGRR